MNKQNSTKQTIKPFNNNIIKNILTVVFAFILLSPPKLLGAENDDFLRFGGALRMNLVHQNYESETRPEHSYATLDMWRINVAAKHSGIGLHFEYRFYPTFNTHFIHHGYLSYSFSESLDVQAGVVSAPFGNVPYNSHNWWFLLPYYVGLEDDYNTGVRLNYALGENLKVQAAYFRQSAPAGPSYGKASFGGPAPGTYSYHIIPDDSSDLSDYGKTASLRELNQLNIRLAYHLIKDTEIGFSFQRKGIYNSALQITDYGNTWAVHLNSDFRNFNLKLQYLTYHYKARDDAGNALERVQMGAYGDPYYGDGVAAKADIITTGLAYNQSVNWGPISQLTPYFNYSVMLKKESTMNQSFSYENTLMLVPGVMLTAGNVYTYIDLAMGKNHPWSTDQFGTGLGKGRLYSNNPDDFYFNESKVNQPVPMNELKWNYRFNINVGYYF